jgi:hypothetical protein
LEEANPLSEDIYTVTSSIFDAFQGVIQYTYDGKNEIYEDIPGDNQRNIRRACALMTDKGTPDNLDRLYNVFLLSNDGNTNFSALYTDSIADLANIAFDGRKYLKLFE